MIDGEAEFVVGVDRTGEKLKHMCWSDVLTALHFLDIEPDARAAAQLRNLLGDVPDGKPIKIGENVRRYWRGAAERRWR